MKLRHRISALIVLILLGSLGASLAFVERRFTVDILSRADQDLAHALAGFRRSELKRFETLDTLAGGLEANPSLRTVVRTHDYATLQEYLGKVREQYRVALILLTDKNGRSLLRTDVPGEKGQDLASQEPVAVALSGYCYSGYWSNQQLYQVVAVPMMGARDLVEGSLILGYRLDRNLADEIARDTGCAVTIATSRTVVAADTHSPAGEPVVLQQVQSLAPDKVGSAPIPFMVQLEGGSYSGLLAPLGTAGQKPAAYITVMHDLRAPFDALHETRMALLALGLGAFLVAILITTPVVGRITQAVELFQTVVHNVGDGLCQVDCNLKVQLLNPAAEQFLGIPSDLARGQHLLSLARLSGSDGPVARETMLSALSARQILRQEDGVILASRRQVSFCASFALAPVLEDGRVSGAVLAFRDISPLVAARQRAEEATRSKSEFLANMSHEIRTPMNGVLGLTRLALRTDLTSVQREYLKGVYASADSLMTIINDILDFSKIEAGVLDFDPVQFSLRETVLQAIQPVALRAHEKGLELASQVDKAVPDTIVADPVRLRQILLNLTGNSVKFTEHGEVVVHVDLDSRQHDQAVLHFRIRDTGIGIAPDKQEKIFQAFSQADASTTRRFGGTGLGLTISARLVQAMGGKIWVESAEEKGSTFHFTAQVQIASEQVDWRKSVVHPELTGMRVLIVDDNATNRQVLEDMLLGWKMQPHSVSSGSEALAAIDQARQLNRPYGLILTDLNMPEMDGFQLASQIQDSQPIIMMLTSTDIQGDRQRARQAGITSYLTKPVNPSSLWDCIVGQMKAPSVPVPRCEEESGELDLPRQPLRILLAEDNPINQTLAVIILEERGHDVTVANHGLEVLEILGRDPTFDLILMDVQMPRMDGFETTAAIRAKEAAQPGQRMPIIALTAHSMSGDKERCMQAGMDDYVSKPILEKLLMEAIDRLLPPAATLSATPVKALPEPKSRADSVALSKAAAPTQPPWRLLYSIIHDIAERNHGETLFRAVADAAPVLLWTADTDKLRNWFNPAWLEFTGRTLEQEIGYGWAESVHPADVGHCLELYFSHFDRREPFRMKYRLKRHDGEYRWLDVTGVPRFSHDGMFEGYIGSCLDVTDSMAPHRDIGIVDLMLERVLSAATEISIIATDPDGLITMFNRGAERILGYTFEEIVGKQTPAIFHVPQEVEQRAQELTFELNLPISGFETFVTKAGLLGSEAREWTYVRKDESTLVVSLVVTSLRDPQGEITGYLGIAEDVSERKQFERTLQQARRAAESLALSKSDLMARVSHEIRTPMSGILGFSNLALNKQAPAEVRDDLEKIHSSADRLLLILNDVLDFCQLEVGQLAIDTMRFNLGSLLSSVQNSFSEYLEKQILDLVITVDPNLPSELIGDAPRIQQVLCNLLGNAFQFSQGGKVGLRITLLQSEKSRCRIHFSLSYSGSNLSQQDQARLFQPFSQANTSLTQLYGGTGLGLAISYKLLQLMDSHFQIESPANQGTSFSFELWLGIASVELHCESHGRHDQRRASSFSQDRRQHGQVLLGTRILVADDNHINRQVVKEYLQLSGVIVDLANHGKEALQLVEQKDYDVILMDIHMPEMGGIEATEKIRHQAQFQDLPIIALTAGVTQKERNRCLACGMQDVITKPVDPELLIATLVRWLKPGSPGVSAEPTLLGDLPGFDLRNLLATLSNDLPMVTQILLSFAEDTKNLPAEIDAWVAAGDLVSARKLVHKIKGASGQIGCMRLYAAAGAVESQLESEDVHDPSLSEFRDAFGQVMATIATLQGHQPGRSELVSPEQPPL